MGKIWLFNPFLPKEAGDELKKTIDSGFINRGKKATEFEQKLREKFGFNQVHLVNSCTSALKLSLKVAGIRPGDEVISTPWSMIATNTTILECGAKPVFVDIKYETLNMDPTLIEEKITKRTKAIMLVHYAGYPADLKKIYEVAQRYNLEVIQDCAHALGARYKDMYIGSLGRFCCFSFQAIKMITTGDGGAISTTDSKVYEDLVRLSWFGINKSKRIKTPIGAFPEDISELGYKHNVTDIDATLGLVGLRHLDQALWRRRQVAETYNHSLGKCKRITLPVYEGDRKSAYWLYPLHVPGKRDSFAKFMQTNGIQVDKHNDRNDRYKIFGGLRSDLPNTARVDKDIVHIPIHPALTSEEMMTVIRKVREWDRSGK